MQRKIHVQAVLLIATVAFAGAAVAGQGGDLFNPIWDQLIDWMQGTLGRIIVGLMILTGIGAGVLRQSLMPFVTGVGGGVGLYAAPSVIEDVLSATVPAVNGIATAISSIPVTL